MTKQYCPAVISWLQYDKFVQYYNGRKINPKVVLRYNAKRIITCRKMELTEQ
jgi:hypothetical protein